MLRPLAILILLSFYGCSDSKLSSRAPASDIDELVSRIANANNPYEVLNLHPSASTIEIERTTSELLQKVSGWNLFELTKHSYSE